MLLMFVELLPVCMDFPEAHDAVHPEDTILLFNSLIYHEPSPQGGVSGSTRTGRANVQGMPKDYDS